MNFNVCVLISMNVLFCADGYLKASEDGYYASSVNQGINGYRPLNKHGARSKRSLDLYKLLAKQSGGSVRETQKNKIKDLVKVIEDVGKASPVLMKKFVWKPFGTITSFPLYVDDQIREFTLTGAGQRANPQIELQRPDGSKETFSNANATSSAIGGNVVRVQIKHPMRGKWLIFRGRSFNQWDVEIVGQSTFTFSYKFVEDVGGTTYPISGRPLSGVNSTLIVDVTGVEHVDTVETLSLYDKDGFLIPSTNTTVIRGSGRTANLFRAELRLPTQEFQVGITGTDKSGNVFERLSSSYEQAIAFKLQVLPIAELYVNEYVLVPYILTNLGGVGNFSVIISDDKGFVQAPVVHRYPSLSSGDRINGTFTIRAGTTKGETSTITVTAKEAGGGKGSQYQIRRLTVNQKIVRKVDTVPPTCNVTKVKNPCSVEQQDSCCCQNFVWSMEMQVRDDGFGLNTVTSTVSRNGNFTHGNFTRGIGSKGVTVAAFVSSTCCEPFVKVNVADMAGNLGQCQTEFPVPPSTIAPASTTAPPRTVIATTSEIETTTMTLSRRSSTTIGRELSTPNKEKTTRKNSAGDLHTATRDFIITAAIIGGSVLGCAAIVGVTVPVAVCLLKQKNSRRKITDVVESRNKVDTITGERLTTGEQRV